MCRKVPSFNSKKNSKKCVGKRGSTLVEISVVLALVAILLAMVGTFSVSIKDIVDKTEEDYNFLEDASALKSTLCEWLAEQDVAGATFDVSSGKLRVSGKAVDFTENSGVLSLGDKTVGGFDNIGRITFESNGDLIKCTALGYGTDTKVTFAFAIRVATVDGGGV